MTKLRGGFAALLKRLGMDADALLQIYGILNTDNARTELHLQSGANSNFTPKQKRIFNYAAMSLMIGLAVAVTDQILLSVGIALVMHFFMMTMLVISDLSDIIIGEKLQTMMAPFPIKPITITQARVFFVIKYVAENTLYFLGIPLFIIGVKYGIVSMIKLLLASFLQVLLIIILSSLIYLIIFRFFDEDKLKSIISYAQIGMTLLISFSYVLFNQFSRSIVFAGDISINWLHYVVPPLWFNSWFIRDGRPITLGLLAVSIVVPIGLFAWFILSLSKNFEAHLAKLKHSAKSSQPTKTNLSNSFNTLHFFTKNKREIAGFNFAMQNMKNDKKLNQLMVTHLSIAIIYPIIDLMSEIPMSVLTNLSYTFIVSTSFNLMYSAYAEGSYIFNVAPNNGYPYFNRGAQKAYIVRYVLPMAIILAGIQYYLNGLQGVLTTLSSLLVTLILIRVYSKKLKGRKYFSADVSESRNNRLVGIGDMLMIMLITFVAASINQYLCHYFLPGFIILSIIYIAVNIYLYYGALSETT